jgi:CubicO group peptidase (beta-lactamase class C family)
MRGSVAVLLVSLLASLLACTPKPDPPPGPDPATAKLVDYLDQAVGTERFRGSVEVRRGSTVLVRRGFGMADPATGTQNGPNTRFRIASITKQFTALAVLILQNEGKLSTANRVCLYLTNCPPQWAAVTVDQLLTHTSGIHDYTDRAEQNSDQFFAAIGGRDPTPEQLVASFASLPLDFPPTTQWKYSNSGYVLLGYLIEKVSGQKYGDFLRNEILDPLGMSDTGYEPGLTAGKGYAVGYEDWGTPALKLNGSVSFAAGGMYSTVTDLGRWQRFLLTDDPAVVTRDTLAELLRPRVPETAQNTTRWYGYGIESRGASMAAVDSFGHSGGLPGFNSYVEARPATGISVTVLANVALNPEEFADNLAALVPGQR